MPRAYQSTENEYPYLWMISGAIYSGVPQKVKVLSQELIRFIKPKSASLTVPSALSIRIFSGFKSL